MSDMLEQVRGLRARVRECQASLDAGAPGDPEVGRAFEDLAAGFTALGDTTGLLAAAPPEERDVLEQELSALVRAHAVLTSSVSRDRDRLCELLERARRSRNAVRAATDPGTATRGWSA